MDRRGAPSRRPGEVGVDGILSNHSGNLDTILLAPTFYIFPIGLTYNFVETSFVLEAATVTKLRTL